MTANIVFLFILDIRQRKGWAIIILLLYYLLFLDVNIQYTVIDS